MRRAGLKSSSQTPFSAEKTFVSKQQDSRVQRFVWAVQQVGFKLAGYELDGSRGQWYLSVEDDAVVLSSEGCEGGVRPGALPVGGWVASRSCAQEFVYRLLGNGR